MYVRTHQGKIFDCYESELMHKPIYYPKNSKTNGYIDFNEVYKKSENIIDIIKVGDYVNGYKVYYCYCADEDSTGLYIDTAKGRVWLDKSSQIKTIVTKESFSQMEYKVVE